MYTFSYSFEITGKMQTQFDVCFFAIDQDCAVIWPIDVIKKIKPFYDALKFYRKTTVY